MKSNILLFALAAGMLVSCDALKDEGTFEVTNVSADQLLEGASFTQYNAVKNEDGSMTYTPAEDGNYIEYRIPKVSAVDIFYKKNDGSEGLLAYGSNSGMFSYVPLRGSDPHQTLYIRYINANLEEVIATKELTLQVAQELSAGDKLLCSNNGAKKWYWNPTSVNGGAVWGNAGYLAGPQTDPNGINGAWWGCGVLDGDCPDKFDGQLQHSAAGAITGEEFSTSYMKFNEDGSIEKFDKDGTLLGTGSFKLEDYKGGEAIDENGCFVAHLKTSAGAILWPYQINNGGYEPEAFEVGYLSVDHMILFYAPAGTGAWSESTWWSFVNYDDAEGMITASKWGWYPTTVNGGAVWGNAGYCAGAQEDPNTINGAWWGCGPLDGDCPDKFDGQLQHSAAGAITGEEYMSAFMEFAEDGTLTAYDKDGNKLREGKFEIDMTPNADTFSLGTLKTSAGAILWPYQINNGGYEPEAFSIGYVSGSNIILVYAPEGTGAWSECTWWSFGSR